MQPPLFDKDQYDKIAERLRIRLDLASFKCKHGYQHMDLYTMESIFPETATTAPPLNKSSIMLVGRPSNKRRHTVRYQQEQEQHHHRYYPTRKDNRKKDSKTSLLSPNATPQRRQQQPSSSPPLSAKRSTSPSRTDELTAQLLLWMCHQKRTTDTA